MIHSHSHSLLFPTTNFPKQILSSLRVPDAQGQVADVVLGFGNIKDWESQNGPYLGAVVGRVGNRIAGGRFTLNGKDYTLAVNNGPNHLHGGLKGFDKVCKGVGDVAMEDVPTAPVFQKIWTAKVDGDAAVLLTYVSPDGEEGYPGTLTASVRYEVTADNGLRLSYTATTDADTPVLLTHHAYFNLSGAVRTARESLGRGRADG